MPKHVLLSGETLEYPRPTDAVAAYLARLSAAVGDPTIDEHRFIELVYSPNNPLLDPNIMPGRGTVTKAVLADPTYHVMQDLLGRKRVALGTLDMDKVRARYSLTVKEAAERAGVHESAIRQAIAAHRLSSVKDGTRHMLDPAQVDAFKPSTTGHAAPLEIVHGSVPGKRLFIKHDGNLKLAPGDWGELGPVPREARHSRLERWTKVAVIAGTKEDARFWELAPGSDVQTIGFEPFAVHGRFKVVRQINNTQQARQAFKDSEGARSSDVVLELSHPVQVVKRTKQSAG
ncbi:MAG: excisionase family DNA-binding protein [Polyangiaceae bacterium]|nr:excisionase family DNA-binding protein [Polyangiaceae bacterium]